MIQEGLNAVLLTQAIVSLEDDVDLSNLLFGVMSQRRLTELVVWNRASEVARETLPF